MKKLVIFDLDGTLLDTIGDLWKSVNFALRCEDRPERTLDEVRSFIGNGTGVLIKKALGDAATPELVENCIGEFSRYYAEHYDEMTYAYDGITECVDALVAKGVACAVVTNKLHNISVTLCDKFFSGRFAKVIGDEPQTPRKPDPYNVLRVIKDVRADEVIYVGDSYVDVITAKNAGVPCVAVTWGFNSKEQLVKAGAEIFADDAEQLLDKILSYFSM